MPNPHSDARDAGVDEMPQLQDWDGGRWFVMTAYDLIALVVLIMVIPLFLRRTFGRRKSGVERNKQNPRLGK